MLVSLSLAKIIWLKQPRALSSVSSLFALVTIVTTKTQFKGRTFIMLNLLLRCGWQFHLFISELTGLTEG